MTSDTVWSCFRTDLSEQFSQPSGSVSESDSVHDQSQSVNESKVNHLVTVSQSVCQLVRQLVSKSVN